MKKNKEVEITFAEGVLEVKIIGDIDRQTIQSLIGKIDRAIEKNNPDNLNMDFSGVRYMNELAIDLVIGRFKLMDAINGKIKIVKIPPQHEKIFKLSGLEALGIF
jgi:stage II sporulation protein AA (anti-sigma F factor antagonist)